MIAVFSKKSIHRLLAGAGTLLMMLVIFLLSAQPGTASDELSLGLIGVLFGQGQTAILLNSVIRELAHALEFAALAVAVNCFFSTFPWSRGMQLSLSLLVCTLYAVGDELHQRFVPDRACELFDVVMDTLGAAVALALYYLIQTRRTSRQMAAAAAHERQIDQWMLEAFSSFVTETPFTATVPDAEMHAFLHRSFAHKVLPMTAESLLQSDAPISEENRRLLKTEALHQVVAQTQKTQLFLRVYRAMCAAGAKPLCVKGAVCGRYYPWADMRISADEDLLAAPEDYQTCVSVLERFGFQSMTEDDAAYVRSFSHPESGCIVELHHLLFPEDGGVYSRFNAALGDLFAHPESVEVGGTELFCPHADQHLLYLVLHAFKHFLVSGVGIRQVADIALTASNTKVDWEALFDRCAQVRAAGFLSAVLKIGEQYFGLDPQTVTAAAFDPRVDADALLRDLLSGGIYGAAEPDARYAGHATLQAYAAAFQPERTALRSALFPPAAVMRRSYPFAAHRLLLPAAYAARLMRYLFSKRDSGRTLRVAARRKKILRQYGVID